VSAVPTSELSRLAEQIGRTEKGAKLDVTIYWYPDGRAIIRGPEDTWVTSADELQFAGKLNWLVREGFKRAGALKRRRRAAPGADSVEATQKALDNSPVVAVDDGVRLRARIRA